MFEHWLDVFVVDEETLAEIKQILVLDYILAINMEQLLTLMLLGEIVIFIKALLLGKKIEAKEKVWLLLVMKFGLELILQLLVKW